MQSSLMTLIHWFRFITQINADTFRIVQIPRLIESRHFTSKTLDSNAVSSTKYQMAEQRKRDPPMYLSTIWVASTAELPKKCCFFLLKKAKRLCCLWDKEHFFHFCVVFMQELCYCCLLFFDCLFSCFLFVVSQHFISMNMLRWQKKLAFLSFLAFLTFQVFIFFKFQHDVKCGIFGIFDIFHEVFLSMLDLQYHVFVI